MTTEIQFTPNEALISEYLDIANMYQFSTIDSISHIADSRGVHVTIRYEEYYEDVVHIDYIDLLGFINKKLNNFMAGIK